MQETPETRVRSLGQKDPLEEGMATHSMESVQGTNHKHRQARALALQLFTLRGTHICLQVKGLHTYTHACVLTDIPLRVYTAPPPPLPPWGQLPSGTSVLNPVLCLGFGFNTLPNSLCPRLSMVAGCLEQSTSSSVYLMDNACSIWGSK